jgi:hypothetical protein
MAHPEGGGERESSEAAAPPPQTTQKPKFKKTHFVDTIILKGLRGLPFSQIKALKSADD